MQRIEDKVVKVMSIAEQIIEAPVETVVVVKYPSRTGSGSIHSDALVKTGVDGYKGSRYDHSGYLNNKDIQRWVNSFHRDSEFYLV